MDLAEAFRHADRDAVPEALLRRAPPATTAPTVEALGLPAEMDGTGPAVSVVIPTYEDSQYLPDALESVGAQTYRNLELVVVDSSGVEWVEQLAADRDWITYLFTDPAGVSTARNDGIDAASGEYVALLDADDYWHPEKIERQVAVLEEGHDAAYSDAYLLKNLDAEPTVRYLELTTETPEAVPQAYLRGGTIATSSLVFRHTALPDRPFNESLDGAEDLMLCVEVFRNHPPVRLPEPLCVRRVREGSLTDDHERMYRAKVEAMQYLADRYPELQAAIDARLSLAYLNRGQALLAVDEKCEARRKLKVSVGLSTWNYRAIGLYLASFVPLNGGQIVELARTLQNLVVTGGSGRPLAVSSGVETAAGK
jgi:hypothetical protein